MADWSRRHRRTRACRSGISSVRICATSGSPPPSRATRAACLRKRPAARTTTLFRANQELQCALGALRRQGMSVIPNGIDLAPASEGLPAARAGGSSDLRADRPRRPRSRTLEDLRRRGRGAHPGAHPQCRRALRPLGPLDGVTAAFEELWWTLYARPMRRRSPPSSGLRRRRRAALPSGASTSANGCPRIGRPSLLDQPERGPGRPDAARGRGAPAGTLPAFRHPTSAPAARFLEGDEGRKSLPSGAAAGFGWGAPRLDPPLRQSPGARLGAPGEDRRPLRGRCCGDKKKIKGTPRPCAGRWVRGERGECGKGLRSARAPVSTGSDRSRDALPARSYAPLLRTRRRAETMAGIGFRASTPAQGERRPSRPDRVGRPRPRSSRPGRGSGTVLSMVAIQAGMPDAASPRRHLRVPRAGGLRVHDLARRHGPDRLRRHPPGGRRRLSRAVRAWSRPTSPPPLLASSAACVAAGLVILRGLLGMDGADLLVGVAATGLTGLLWPTLAFCGAVRNFSRGDHDGSAFRAGWDSRRRSPWETIAAAHAGWDRAGPGRRLRAQVIVVNPCSGWWGPFSPPSRSPSPGSRGPCAIS